MTTYYIFLWVVGLLNLLRCFALVAEAQQSSPFLLNVLWLMTRFGEPQAIQKLTALLINISAAYCNGRSRAFWLQPSMILQMFTYLPWPCRAGDAGGVSCGVPAPRIPH